MGVIDPVHDRCPASLLAAICSATRQRADWQRTAELVASQVRRTLPEAGLLTAAERAGRPDGYQSHILHVQPNGSFSVIAVVWRPGQITPIHDHVTWCVTAVLQGTVYEELYRVSPDGRWLEQAGYSRDEPGDVSGFAPPGDIHQVRNYGSGVAISLHVYGADITRLGSSVRRTYDLPIAAPALA